MKPNEAITLQAFLVALSQLDATLPPEIQVKIHHLGNGLMLHQSEAIAAIDDLVRQHAQLHRLYELAWAALQQKQYQCLPNQQVSAETASVLETVATQVLSSGDPQKTAYGYIKQAKQTEHTTSDPSQAICNCLSETAALLEEQTTALLRAVERRPLTAENLSYVLQMSVDQVLALIQYLWNAGYIDPTSVNVFHKIFPNFRRAQNVSRETTQQALLMNPAYFTLTAKGFFHLHPLVTADRHEGISE